MQARWRRTRPPTCQGRAPDCVLAGLCTGAPRLKVGRCGPRGGAFIEVRRHFQQAAKPVWRPPIPTVFPSPEVPTVFPPVLPSPEAPTVFPPLADPTHVPPPPSPNRGAPWPSLLGGGGGGGGSGGGGGGGGCGCGGGGGGGEICGGVEEPALDGRDCSGGIGPGFIGKCPCLIGKCPCLIGRCPCCDGACASGEVVFLCCS